MILPSDASADQSNCPPDYYRRSNGMLHQIPADQPPESPQIDATALEAMSREELLALVKKMPGYPVALLTDDETAEALLMRLKIDALTTKDARQAVANANAWFDRVQGKALQRIDQRVIHAHKGPMVDMPTNELMALVHGIKQLPNGIRLLADGTLDIVDATPSVETTAAE